MAQLYSFKIQGQTAADVEIDTVAVSYDDDGMLRFTDANGKAREIPINGDLSQLLKEIFTGTGGITADGEGTIGHRPMI